MIYSMSAPGKLLRPALLFLCAARKTNKERNSQDIYYWAAAVEAIHTYTLLHDDLPAMDDSQYRRGKKSCHIQYSEWQAILAGNALQNLAFELICKVSHKQCFHKAIHILTIYGGMQGVLAGQALDLLFETQHELASTLEKSEIIEELYVRKTSSLLQMSCNLGALFANANDAQIVDYDRYGYKLCILFQMKDDLLDIEGKQEVIGKPTGHDKNKLTYSNVYGIAETKKRARAICSELEEHARNLPLPPDHEEDHRALLQALPQYVLERSL